MTSTLNSVYVKRAQAPGSAFAGLTDSENEVGVPDVAMLHRLGEHFAAGYFELPGASPMRCWSRAVRRRFERRHLMPYDGGVLYPTGPRIQGAPVENRIVEPSYSFTYTVNAGALRTARSSAGCDEAVALDHLETVLSDLADKVNVWDSPHTVGGRGYTHSIPNYGRVLREGLDAHAARIAAGLDSAHARAHATAAASSEIDFYLGLQDVLAGIRCWHGRILAMLEGWTSPDPEACQRRDRLVTALRQVPFQPARTFYEALVAYNFVFYLDDCDNPGRLDRELDPFYTQDVANGTVTRDEALDMLRAFTANVCANDAWSAAIGGTLPDGRPAYNEVTRLCIEAVRHRHRPSYELGVRPVPVVASQPSTMMAVIAPDCVRRSLACERRISFSGTGADAPRR